MEVSMTEKKKIIILRILYIAAFAVIMYFASRLLCFKTMHGSSQCLGMYAQPKNTVDVVMLGTSHMHCDVNPAILWEDEGIASYVFSAAEQPLWITYYYLIEFCKYQDPKLVVLDLYAPARYKDKFAPEWIGENLYNIRFSMNKLKMIASSCTWEQANEYFPSFFGYHDRYKELSKEDLDMMIPSADDADFKGFVPYFSAIEGMEPTLDVTEKGNITPKSEIYLRKIIEYTKENGIDLYLVVNPYPTTAEEEEIYNRIHSIANAEGVLFRSTNFDSLDMGLDFDKDYNDVSHLNYSGSCKYSHFLAANLKENFDIPDRRGDPRYISWDRNAAKNEEEYGNAARVEGQR